MVGEQFTFVLTAPQTVAYTGTAGTSTVLGSETTTVRLVATTDSWIFITQAGTAATTGNGFFLPANTVEYVRCPTAAKVSVIRDAASGNLYLAECDR